MKKRSTFAKALMVTLGPFLASSAEAKNEVCGPEFVQELQDQFLCTNSVKLGGCVSIANDKNGGVKTPPASAAKGSKEALDKFEELKRKQVGLEGRLKALNEEHTILQEKLKNAATGSAGPRTSKAIVEARADLIATKLAIDGNRKKAYRASKELADLLNEFATVAGSKEKPILEYPADLILLDQEAAKLLTQKQMLLIERGSAKERTLLDRKIDDVRAERAEYFRAIAAPVKSKVSRRNRFNLMQGLAGNVYGKALGSAIQNVTCASQVKDVNSEIFKYADIDNNCEFWIGDEQFEKFVSLFPSEQLELLKKHPRLCGAYQEHLDYLRTPKVAIKGDPRCLVNGGSRFESTIEVNGREYNHAFELGADGSVLVRGAFDPGGYPGEENMSVDTKSKTFTIRFDNQMRGGTINVYTSEFGLVSDSMMNVAAFKRQYFIYKENSKAPTAKELKQGATDDFMDRKLVASVGEQIEAIQTYAPALFKICSERKNAIGLREKPDGERPAGQR